MVNKKNKICDNCKVKVHKQEFTYDTKPHKLKIARDGLYCWSCFQNEILIDKMLNLGLIERIK